MEQKTPTEMPKGMKMKKEGGEEEKKEREIIWQMWERNGTRCPKGTVPIRRSSVHDVLRAKSLYHFGKKPARSLSPLTRPPDVISANGHEVPPSYPLHHSIINIHIHAYIIFSITHVTNKFISD